MPPRTGILVSTNGYLAFPFISALPFLYQTRTLQPQLLFRNEKGVIHRCGAHRSFHSTPTSNAKSHEIPFDDTASSRTVKGSSYLDGSRKSDFRRLKKSDFRRLKVSGFTEPHIQFSPSHITASGSIIPHSTITASEKAAFEKLSNHIALSNMEEDSSEDVFDDEFSSELGNEVEGETIEDIDVLFESAIERQNSLEENHGATSSIERPGSEEMRLESLRKSHEEAFAKKLESTKTDIEVWTLLEKEVFWLFGGLKKRYQDSKTPEATPSVKKGKAAKGEQKKGTDSTKTSKDVLSVMESNYSDYCLSALRLLRREFPSSPYVLHLLPTIKRLGPISYVLGASTALYNEILFVKWTQYSDLAGMADLVKEMLDKGVEVNEVSINLLVAVAKERQKALSAYGDVDQATKAWWQLSGVQDSWDRVRLLLAASIQGLRRRRAREEREQMNDDDKDNLHSAGPEVMLRQDSDEQEQAYEGGYRSAESPAKKLSSQAFHMSKEPSVLGRHHKV